MLSLSLLVCGLSLASRGSALLGSAASFGVLGWTSLDSVGETRVTGDMGSFPGGITGFPPGTVSGATHNADFVAETAQEDALLAFKGLAALPPTSTLSGQDLGGMHLSPGVYKFESPAQLTGLLTLDAGGDSNAKFIFQFGATFTTAPSSSVVVVNNGKPCNIYWVVGTSAFIGAGTSSVGNFLAAASITAGHGVNSQGGLYALDKVLSLDAVQVSAQENCI